MRNLAVILILFFVCSVSAQSIVSTVKTYSLGSDNVNYFEVITVTYDDESQTITKKKVGPAASLAADQADKIEAEMQRLANSAAEVSRANRIISEAVAAAGKIDTLTGVSPLKIIQDKYDDVLLTAGWTIDQGAGFVSLVFTVNAQGNLRYSINGAATKAATIYGDGVIRLNAYPSTGTNTDFYLSENSSRYFSLPNRAAIIKKP